MSDTDKNQQSTTSDNILQKLLGEIQQDRDELKLQAHLFKVEAKDEWDEIEKKWHHFKVSTQHVGHETKEVSKDLLAATQLLGEEINAGLKRIIKSL
jgi:hypothetical protein